MDADPQGRDATPPAQAFDMESAEAYVRELYRFVLHRPAGNPDGLRHWTEYLVAHQDPVDVFRRFATSQENTQRIAAAERSAVGYPPGHFYSPVVDVEEAERDAGRIFGARELREVDLNLPAQQRTFASIAARVGSMPFSDEADGRHRYRYNNTSYGYGDAAVYWAFLAEYRPSRIIEVGSGFTSALALDAIDHFKLDTRCTFIDPYPELLRKVAAPFPDRHEIIADRVQQVDPAIVETLQPNDFLFIDSSHVVKTGSDVHFELTELLPRVRPGVIVHFHDVLYPFEYHRSWVVDQRKSWNELYFLHAFLMYNQAFRIVYFNHCFPKLSPQSFSTLPGAVRERLLLNPGGGLWLRRS